MFLESTCNVICPVHCIYNNDVTQQVGMHSLHADEAPAGASQIAAVEVSTSRELRSDCSSALREGLHALALLTSTHAQSGRRRSAK